MRKWITTALVAAVAVIGISVTSNAAGTENAWSIDLTLSTTNSSDLLAITVGEGQSAAEQLKPPPLPGMSDTGSSDPTDAVVNAYVVTSAAREASRSIAKVDTDAPAHVWAIDVDTEETGVPLSLEIDASELYSKYDVTVVDADNQTITEFESSDFDTNHKASKQVVASTKSTQRLYVVVGENQTFAVESDGTMFGAARLSAPGRVAGVEVKLLDSSCTQVGSTATTNADGIFTMPSITATGKHYLHFDKQYAVGSECEIDITGTGASTTACRDVYAGDFSDDGAINALDLAKMKPAYGKPSSDPNYNVLYDITADDVINALDLARMKPAYGSTLINESSPSNACKSAF